MFVNDHLILLLAMLLPPARSAPIAAEPVPLQSTCEGAIVSSAATPCSTPNCNATWELNWSGYGEPDCGGCFVSWDYTVAVNGVNVALGNGHDWVECGDEVSPPHGIRCPCSHQLWFTFTLVCDPCEEE